MDGWQRKERVTGWVIGVNPYRVFLAVKLMELEYPSRLMQLITFGFFPHWYFLSKINVGCCYLWSAAWTWKKKFTLAFGLPKQSTLPQNWFILKHSMDLLNHLSLWVGVYRPCAGYSLCLYLLFTHATIPSKTQTHTITPEMWALNVFLCWY